MILNYVMKVEVSHGELLDKLTILELKLSNIKDSKQLANIKKEYDELNPLAKKLFEKYEENNCCNPYFTIFTLQTIFNIKK